jgi:hypothetical protein
MLDDLPAFPAEGVKIIGAAELLYEHALGRLPKGDQPSPQTLREWAFGRCVKYLLGVVIMSDELSPVIKASAGGVAFPYTHWARTPLPTYPRRRMMPAPNDGVASNCAATLFDMFVATVDNPSPDPDWAAAYAKARKEVEELIQANPYEMARDFGAAMAWLGEQLAAWAPIFRKKDALVSSAQYNGFLQGRNSVLTPDVLRTLKAAWFGRKEMGDAGGGGRRPRRRRRPPLDPKIRPVTPKQTEAVQIVGECQGNLAAAARKLGIDRKTLKERYDAACKKLGIAATKHRTRALPKDRRGQEDVAAGDDGPAMKQPGGAAGVRRDRRRG